MMRIIKKLEQSSSYWFLLISVFFFFLFRLPSLFEPYWYGDEGIYQAMGLVLSRGGMLYRDTWDNKPPFLYLIYGLFDGDQTAVRIVSLLFGIAAVVIFYFLSKKLFIQKKAQFFSTGLFVLLFSLPVLEGNIANAENFMLTPILLGGLFIYSLIDKKNEKDTVRIQLIGSVLLASAFLFKIVGLFDAAAFFLFAFFLSPKQTSFIASVKKVSPYILGFCTPILIFILYFLFLGEINKVYFAIFGNMIGYVSYGNNFFIPHGLLLLKLFLLGSAVGFLYVKRFVLPKNVLFIALWVTFGLFSAFFSQRPYTHYLLMLLPSFCLLFGLTFAEKKYRLLTIPTFAIVFFLAYTLFWHYAKVIPYYANFFQFLSGQKSVTAYLGFFDRHTPIDYQVVQYLKKNLTPTDRIYVWGNNAQLYKLLERVPPGRFVVAYHILGLPAYIQEMTTAINTVKPRYIIVTTQTSMPFSLSNYTLRVIIGNDSIYERVF